MYLNFPPDEPARHRARKAISRVLTAAQVTPTLSAQHVYIFSTVSLPVLRHLVAVLEQWEPREATMP